jgi:hypothetical protein
VRLHTRGNSLHCYFRNASAFSESCGPHKTGLPDSSPSQSFSSFGRNSDESALPMNRRSVRCPSLDNRNRFAKESCDLLPAFQRLGRCFLCYAFGHIRRAWFASESE